MVRVINKNPLEVFDFQGNALRCVRDYATICKILIFNTMHC